MLEMQEPPNGRQEPLNRMSSHTSLGGNMATTVF